MIRLRQNPLIGILLLLFPIFVLYFFTRRRIIQLYFEAPEWESYRRITPFSAKVNFYLWALFIIGGSIFVFISLLLKVLYDLGIID